jgi:hypothetical protein
LLLLLDVSFNVPHPVRPVHNHHPTLSQFIPHHTQPSTTGNIDQLSIIICSSGSRRIIINSNSKERGAWPQQRTTQTLQLGMDDGPMEDQLPKPPKRISERKKIHKGIIGSNSRSWRNMYV